LVEGDGLITLCLVVYLGLARTVHIQGWPESYIYRVGQNCIYTPFITVKFWPTLYIRWFPCQKYRVYMHRIWPYIWWIPC
jgi:hypothetical protein